MDVGTYLWVRRGASVPVREKVMAYPVPKVQRRVYRDGLGGETGLFNGEGLGQGQGLGKAGWG